MKTLIIGVLHKDGKFLVERRHTHEKFFPGSVQFPGGAIDPGETDEVALKREMKEELDIEPVSYTFLQEHFYPDDCKGRVYLIDRFTGEPKALEAKEVFWIENEKQITEELDKGIFRKALNSLK